MLGAEVARPLAVADADAGVADRPRQDHERRQSTRRAAAQMRQHRSVMGIFLAAAEQEAGLHHLMAGLVDRRRLVMDRADDGVAVGHLGHEREVLADLDAGDVGLDRPERAADRVGGVGLEVPGVELAGAADQEEQDAVDVRRTAAGLDLLGLQQIGQRQAHGPGREGPDAQEIAPRQTIAKTHTLVAFPLQHGTPPTRSAEPTAEVQARLATQPSRPHPNGPQRRCNQKLSQDGKAWGLAVRLSLQCRETSRVNWEKLYGFPLTAIVRHRTLKVSRPWFSVMGDTVGLRRDTFFAQDFPSISLTLSLNSDKFPPHPHWDKLVQEWTNQANIDVLSFVRA